MPRVSGLVARIAVPLVLAASVYLGLANMSDIVKTSTLGERLVGVTAVGYGVTGAVALVALLLRRPWLRPVILVWAFLVVTTAVAATIVYGDNMVASLAAGAITLLLVAPVVWYARRTPAT